MTNISNSQWSYAQECIFTLLVTYYIFSSFARRVWNEMGFTRWNKWWPPWPYRWVFGGKFEHLREERGLSKLWVCWMNEWMNEAVPHNLGAHSTQRKRGHLFKVKWLRPHTCRYSSPKFQTSNESRHILTMAYLLLLLLIFDLWFRYAECVGAKNISIFEFCYIFTKNLVYNFLHS